MLKIINLDYVEFLRTLFWWIVLKKIYTLWAFFYFYIYFQGKIGFLSIENRVCVALSRAKKGLYCIGNFEVIFCSICHGKIEITVKCFHFLVTSWKKWFVEEHSRWIGTRQSPGRVDATSMQNTQSNNQSEVSGWFQESTCR